jgi:hypothetical protein
MNAGIGIRTFRTPSAIEEVREVWKSWQYHPNSDVDFYLTVNRLRPQILRPHVMVLYRDNHPDAMLAGRIVNERIAFKAGYKTIFGVNARVLSIAYGGLLGNLSSENSQAMLKEVTCSLRRGEAEAVRFKDIPMNSDFFRTVAQAGGRLRDRSITPNEHWRLNLPGDYAEFLKSRSSKIRQDIRRYARRFREAYGNDIEIRCYRHRTELDRMCVDMETISAKTYHRGLGVGFADSAETRGLFAMASDREWLRAYVLYVRGTPCAFWEGLMYRQSFFPTNTAYDPAFEEHRPGAFLLMHIIEQLCGERVSQIDFGFGDANYKRWYSNQNWQEASLCIYAPSMKGLALIMLKTPMALAEHTVKKGLEKVQLLQRVKTLWRRHMCVRQQGAPAG